MIILRKIFSEKEDLEEQIKEDKKELLERGKKKRDIVVKTAPYVSGAFSAIPGYALGDYIVGKSMEYPVKGYIKEVNKLVPHPTVNSISADSLEELGEIIKNLGEKVNKVSNKYSKVAKVVSSKPFRYGIPLATTTAAAIAGKKYMDNELDKVMHRKKKDDNSKK